MAVAVPAGKGIDEAGEERFRFRFTGDGGEYFRIWIVNVLLSILTLYVYSAWAKVRTNRYFHGNTVLDGAAFEYHARPLQILAGRVVAVLALIVVTVTGQLNEYAFAGFLVLLPLVMPWVLWRTTIFNARMTSYRNVRLDFRGRVGGMYLYLLVLPMAPLLAMGTLAALTLAVLGESDLSTLIVGTVVVIGTLVSYGMSPWLHCLLAEYFADNHRYGRARFAATLSRRRFYAIYGQSLLLAIGLGGVVALLFSGAIWGPALLASVQTPMSLDDGAAPVDGAMVLVASLLVYPAILLVKAFFQAGIRNHLYDSTTVDGRVRLQSSVRTWGLWRLMFGNLFLLYVTAGIAWPWVKVRLARFFTMHTALLAPGGLHAVVDDEHERQSSLGEEIGDAFDLGMDVGF